jgi:hypothetical protein
MSESDLTAAVIAVLKKEIHAERRLALTELRDSSPAKVLDVVISLLTSPDPLLRRRAGWGLGCFQKLIDPKTDVLAGHLVHNADPEVRLSCAIVLMSSPAPTVTLAYRNALADTYEKVVQIACLELAHRGGSENTAALFRTLTHSSWRVRLEACKGLIIQGKADQRVVSALEAMQLDPEADSYDAEIDEIARIELAATKASEKSVPIPRWGKLHAILDQSRSLGPK